MKSKANQIHLKKTKIIQDVMSMHYQKIYCRKIIRVIIILGGLSVFSPRFLIGLVESVTTIEV